LPPKIFVMIIEKMPKKFNFAGPMRPEDDYCIDPLSRIDLEEIMNLINSKRYFILHAPRQTGKTSCLLALRDYINKQGRYYAVYANIENAQTTRNDVKRAMQTIVGVLMGKCENLNLPFDVYEMGDKIRNTEPAENMLKAFLERLCRKLDKPLVLFLDEIDAMVGDSLVSVLRQLRAGYESRPTEFPISLILCGVRDVRDYRITTSCNEIITGGSAFNIKAVSLRLGNFTKEQIHDLYMQHTEETGQRFDDSVFPMVWKATEGQPWLVNALAYEVTHNMRENRDRSVVIIPEMMYKAQENIIYRRETHIDALIDKLREERVKRVIEPILVGNDVIENDIIPDDDIQYCIDLGLITLDKPRRIANDIYKEIIPRELTWTVQTGFVQQSAWYINDDGSINAVKLLTEFQDFYRENADIWQEKFAYKEAGPQLLLQAFLQRVVNGGGYIDREYGLGRRRTDLLIRKPLTEKYGGPYQYIAMELKIRRYSIEKTISDGLAQTADYMDHCPAGTEGHFIMFDKSKDLSWDEKIFHEVKEFNGKTIHVWGM